MSADNERPRKYCALTAEGEAQLAGMIHDWQLIRDRLDILLGGDA